jgi:thiol:disulfide interchange protein DsbD
MFCKSHFRNALSALALMLGCVGGLWAQSNAAVVNTGQVRAELMVWAPQGLGPGKTMWLGLHIQHQKGWHTYWKNPGDSGLPTQLQWQLPSGWSAGETHWPTPDKIRVGEMTNYGFEGSSLLAAPVSMTAAAKPTEAQEVTLQANWLVCRQECIPQEGRFVLRIPGQSSQAVNGPLFEALLRQQPQALAMGASLAQVHPDRLALTITGLPQTVWGQKPAVFVELPEVIDHAGETHPRSQGQWRADQWQMDLPLHPMRSTQPQDLPLVLVFGKGAESTAWRVSLPTSGVWPALPSPGAGLGQLPSSTPAISVSATSSPLGANWGASFWLALITALLGGLVLNLMPCVLPVLAIKVVALGLPGQSPLQRRRDGAAYSAGVVLTFVALGAAVLMFRAAGEQLGWGFQLQSPLFVSALALLFTALALNLMGLFEWGQLWPAAWGGWQSQHPEFNAFASGVLAVGLASPCTAPFVGVSMGWALSQAWPSALAVLAAMGVGMALPYALLSLWPTLGKFLPQPGAWMNVFKTLMAFPLWITVVWLLWVLGQQTSLDAAMAVLLVLLATAALIWSWGLPKPIRQWLVLLSCAAWLACAWVTWPRLNASEEPSRTASATWQSWSSLAVKDRLDRGQAVFVDFTAAWCVTCQLNKQTTLSHPDVLREFERQNISLMRADWTRRDPSITRALAELGRSGVPVYVLYQPGQAPLVLSELLSPTLVLDTLKQR